MLTGYSHVWKCRHCRRLIYFRQAPDGCRNENCNSQAFERIDLDPKTGRVRRRKTARAKGR